MTPEGKSNPISPKIPTVDGRSHEISIQSPFFMIKSRSISIFHHTIFMKSPLFITKSYDITIFHGKSDWIPMKHNRSPHQLGRVAGQLSQQLRALPSRFAPENA
jgi:hypothetical protein